MTSLDGHIAALYARQLISELPSVANMRDAGLDGRAASIRAHTVRKLFDDLLGRAGARTLLEIGCHEAEASRRFVAAAPDRNAHAVEANPGVLERTKADCKDNRVVFHGNAISASRGAMTFNVPVDPKLALWGSLKSRATHVEMQTIEVDAITLDDLAERVGLDRPGPRDVGLWMDVEGAALDVVSGGATLVAHRVCAIYVELQDSNVFGEGGDSLHVIAALVAHGFVPVARDNQFPNAFNLLFAHGDLYRAAHDLIGTFHVDARRRALDAGAGKLRRAVRGTASPPAPEPFSELSTLFEAKDVHGIGFAERQPLTAGLEQLFKDAVGHFNPTASVEVGAFDASMSAALRSRYPAVRAVAFEANPHVVERYGAKAQAASVDYRHLAVSNVNGVMAITIPTKVRDREIHLANTMASIHQMRAATDSVGVEVPAGRLDDALDLPDDETCVLWVDVEGAMEGLIAGAAGTLAKTRMLLCEVESAPIWSGQLLAPAVIKRLGEHGLVPLLRDFQRPHQFNVLFVRKADLPLPPPLDAAVRQYVAEARRTVADLLARTAPKPPVAAPDVIRAQFERYCADALQRITSATPPPAASLDAVVQRIREALDGDRPLSVVRLGDGEGACLFRPEAELSALRADVVGRTLYLHFGGGAQRWTTEDFDRWATWISGSAAAADVVAAPSLAVAQRLGEARGDEIRGTVGTIEAALFVAEGRARREGLAYPTGYLHKDLLPHYRPLLAGRQIAAVTCYDEAFVARLATNFGAEPTARIGIPEQAVNVGRKVPRPLYPDEIARVRAEVDAAARPGVVVLVAAGLAAKELCVRAAARGAVAIDVGSMMDVWHGTGVRPYQSDEFVRQHRLPASG